MAEHHAVRTGPVVVDNRVGPGPTVLAVVCGWLLATRQSIVVPFTLGLTPTAIAWYAGGILLLLCWLARQPIRAPHRPTTLIAMVMFLTTLVSSAALTVRGASSGDDTASMLLLVRDVGLLAAVVLILVLVRTTADVTRVVEGIVIGAAISATLALLQAATGLDLAEKLVLPGLTDQGSTAMLGELLRAGALRPQGSAGHPLELSAVLTVTFPLALGLAFARRARGVPHLLWAGLAGLIALGAVSTISRSAIVGIVAALAVMAWSWPVRRVVTGGVSLVVVVLGAIVAGVPLVSRLAEVTVGGTSDNSIGSRSSGLSYALEQLPQHWWLGQGSGTYDPAKQPVLDNFYLTRLVESGVLGLVGLLLLVVGAWIVALRASRLAIGSPDAGAFELVNGVLGAVTAIAVVGLILDIGGFAQISTLLFVLVGLAGSASLALRSPHE